MEASLCPFCGRHQLPTDDDHWRCADCNLWVTPRDLVAPGEAPQLDDVSRDFCPWCAFPLARELSLPEEEEFVCIGCSGTLTVDTLVTQAAIDAYRKRSLGGKGFFWFAFALIACIAAIVYLLR